MIKSFNELAEAKVNITKKPTFKFDKARQEFVEIPGKEIDTISWVDCLCALYENGAAKVLYDNVQNKDGGLLFKDENNCIHILVYVDIDGDRREIFYPVIDGSKDIKLDKITQSDIYNAKQRAFVKCVALNWGLGIRLWKKADETEIITKVQDSYSVYENFRALVNNATKKLGGIPELLKVLNTHNEKTIKNLIESAIQIDSITKSLEKVLNSD